MIFGSSEVELAIRYFTISKPRKADLSLTPLLRKGKPFRFSKDIRKKLKSAIHQLSNKDPKLKGDIGIGMVFMRLYLPRGVSTREQKAALQRLKQEITSGGDLKALKVDFVALHFASHSLVKKIGNFYNDPYHDLGLGILGKIKRL